MYHVLTTDSGQKKSHIDMATARTLIFITTTGTMITVSREVAMSPSGRSVNCLPRCSLPRQTRDQHDARDTTRASGTFGRT